MYIEQKREFSPLTIVIQSEAELAELYVALNESSEPDSVGRILVTQLYENGVMSENLAKIILKKS